MSLSIREKLGLSLSGKRQLKKKELRELAYELDCNPGLTANVLGDVLFAKHPKIAEKIYGKECNAPKTFWLRIRKLYK